MMINYYKQTQEMNERNYIYILKFFAVISIVSAHVTSIPDLSNDINILASSLIGSIASFGVPMFFLLSGYLFYNNSDSLKKFMQKKLVSIFIPWIVSGTMVFIYIAVRKGGLNLSGWINFLVGNGSYLYYLTILTSFYCIFWKYRNKKIILGSLVLFIISLTLTANGLLEEINQYLNPFNFIGYFAIGLLLKRYKYSLFTIGGKIKNKKIILIITFITLTVFTKYYGIKSGYFGNATIIAQTIAILMILSIATWDKLYNKLFISIGKESFAIYLLHMPVAGVTVALTNLIGNGFVTLVRPIIVITVVYGAITIYKKINVLGLKPEYKNILIGSR